VTTRIAVLIKRGKKGDNELEGEKKPKEEGKHKSRRQWIKIETKNTLRG
jgi:hypothetical protein